MFEFTYPNAANKSEMLIMRVAYEDAIRQYWKLRALGMDHDEAAVVLPPGIIVTGLPVREGATCLVASTSPSGA